MWLYHSRAEIFSITILYANEGKNIALAAREDNIPVKTKCQAKDDSLFSSFVYL